MKYWIVISDRMIVSLVDNEEVAESIMGDGMYFGDIHLSNESDVKAMQDLLQDMVDSTLQILDNNRQKIELENMASQKTKGELN